jgi:hypothetical protein
MPTEADILAARLTRMKQLIEALEAGLSESGEQREIFLKLKQEMTAAREALKIPPSSQHSFPDKS